MRTVQVQVQCFKSNYMEYVSNLPKIGVHKFEDGIEIGFNMSFGPGWRLIDVRESPFAGILLGKVTDFYTPFVSTI